MPLHLPAELEPDLTEQQQQQQVPIAATDSLAQYLGTATAVMAADQWLTWPLCTIVVGSEPWVMTTVRHLHSRTMSWKEHGVPPQGACDMRPSTA